MFALLACGATIYGLLRFQIDELGSERIDRLRDERAYFARLFAVDKRCLHHANCTSDGPKNVESGKVYTEKERDAIFNEFHQQEIAQSRASEAREEQKTARKRVRKLKKDLT